MEIKGLSWNSKVLQKLIMDEYDSQDEFLNQVSVLRPVLTGREGSLEEMFIENYLDEYMNKRTTDKELKKFFENIDLVGKIEKNVDLQVIASQIKAEESMKLVQHFKSVSKFEKTLSLYDYAKINNLMDDEQHITYNSNKILEQVEGHFENYNIKFGNNKKTEQVYSDVYEIYINNDLELDISKFVEFYSMISMDELEDIDEYDIIEFLSDYEDVSLNTLVDYMKDHLLNGKDEATFKLEFNFNQSERVVKNLEHDISKQLLISTDIMKTLRDKFARNEFEEAYEDLKVERKLLKDKIREEKLEVVSVDKFSDEYINFLENKLEDSFEKYNIPIEQIVEVFEYIKNNNEIENDKIERSFEIEEQER